MAINAVNDPILASSNQLLLGLAIPGRKEHIFVDRQDEHFCFDAAQGFFEIPSRQAADISALPFPRHAQEIVRVHHTEIQVQEVSDEVVYRRTAERTPTLLFEELGTPAHDRPELSVP